MEPRRTPTPDRVSDHSPRQPADQRAPERKPARGSDTVTQGVRVTVMPFFWAERSDPTARSYMFRYRVRIANEGATPAQLLKRFWRITDALGNINTVDGTGVVGEFPNLAPGQSFSYESFCPIATHWGTMEGHYSMCRPDGTEFAAAITRFYLVSKDPSLATEDVVEMPA